MRLQGVDCQAVALVVMKLGEESGFADGWMGVGMSVE
jgi:hypothetical protein